MPGSLTRTLRTTGPALFAALLLLAPPGMAAAAPQEQPQPKEIKPQAQPSPPLSAPELAEATLQAMGGKPAWDAARHICFTFAARRAHCWDRNTGRHRLEGQSAEGKTFVVLSNINTREGSAYLDGQPLTGEQGTQYVEGAYQAWVNDTYWLLAPFKLQDPGVNLTYEGSEELDGVRYEKLGMTFNNVGLTPGDRYWVYINPISGLVERWAYVLQNQDPNTQPTHWLWQGWQKYGSIMLAPTRAQVGADEKIEFTNIAVRSNVPDEVYTSPAPTATGQGQGQQPQQQQAPPPPNQGR